MSITQIQIVIEMKRCLYILFLFCFSLAHCQINLEAKKGYNLYIYYEEAGDIFTKPIIIENDSVQFMVYQLHIPNQKHPTVSFSFDEKGDLKVSIKGANGNNQNYWYSFSYNGQKCRQFLISDIYMPNKINLNWIMSSNLEIFDKVLQKATTIYVLEHTDKKGYEYIAREVGFSEYKGL